MQFRKLGFMPLFFFGLIWEYFYTIIIILYLPVKDISCERNKRNNLTLPGAKHLIKYGNEWMTPEFMN